VNHRRPSSLSRRHLIQLTAVGVGALVNRRLVSAALPLQSSNRLPEYGQPLQEFRHDQIEFEPGLHDAQMEQTHSVLMNLDVDSVLKPFRRRVGLPAPGCNLGGFYDEDPEIFGLFISALARYYLIKKDEQTRTKIERLLKEFAQTVESRGKIYGAKVNAAMHDRIARALLDAHQYVRDPITLDTLSRVTDAVTPLLPRKATRDSAGGWTLIIPEGQFLAWQYTGDKRHLDLATQYLYEEFFDALARGQNCLANRNALAHMNALNSAAKAYLVLGEERYLRAARNGFAFVEAQSYVTGGWGPHECFIPSSMPWGEAGTPEGWMPVITTLADSIKCTHWHFQTAPGADAHLNLTRYLLRITKDATYGDSMERVMYNTVLGALPLQQSGMVFYNSDYHNDGRKTYFDNYGFIGEIGPEWPLEAGVLPLVAADYRINAYLRDEEGVYVNLFIPSTLRWQQHGSQVSLKQTGTYPLGDKVVFTLSTSRPLEFTLRLRIPAWAEQPSISVNGKRIATTVKPGTFTPLRQAWRSGDRIELELPRRLALKAVDAAHPDMVALVYEPLVLFAVTTETPRFTRRQLLSAERAAEESHEWQVNVSGQTVRFVPFWVIKHERYSTYLLVTA
jgi:DUF1680 family protein